MKGFCFRLQKVLEWRRTELDLEQARLEQEMLESMKLDSERADLEAAGIRSEFEVRAWRPLTGSDLAALAAFRRHVVGKEKQIEDLREEARRKLESRKTAVIEARRRCELLERMKQRRREEWQAAADRELEQAAAESYLARFARRGASEKPEARSQKTEDSNPARGL
jgi:flagellar export protein FliJ